jgi:hypothetical protein
VLSGRSFRLEQPVAMVATDQWRPVVEFAGFPVALSGRVQGAMVIATATASLLHALGGERRSGGDHPAVPVVDGSSWRVRAPHGSEALDEDFMTAAGRAAREMPAGVHDALVRFGDDPGECGVLLLRGINLGPVPATPAGAAAVGSSGKDLTSEFALLAAARRPEPGRDRRAGVDLVQGPVGLAHRGCVPSALATVLVVGLPAS